MFSFLQVIKNDEAMDIDFGSVHFISLERIIDIPQTLIKEITIIVCIVNVIMTLILKI